MKSRNRILSGILSCLTCLGSVGSAAKNKPAASPAGEARRKNGRNKKGDRNAKGKAGISPGIDAGKARNKGIVPGASTTTPRSGLSGREIGFFIGGAAVGGVGGYLLNKGKSKGKSQELPGGSSGVDQNYMELISDRKKIINILDSVLNRSMQFKVDETAIRKIMSFVELIANAAVDNLVRSPSEDAEQLNPGPDKFLKSLTVTFDENHDPMKWGSLTFTVDYKKLEEKYVDDRTKGSEFYEATFKAKFNLKADVEEFVLKPVKISALFYRDGENLRSYDGAYEAVHRGVVLYILSKFFGTKVDEFIKKLEDKSWVHVIDLLSDILRYVCY